MRFNVTVDEGTSGFWHCENGVTTTKLKLSIKLAGAYMSEKSLYFSVLNARLKTSNPIREWAFIDSGGRQILGYGPLPFSNESVSETDNDLSNGNYLCFSWDGSIDNGWFEEGDTLELTLICSSENIRERLSFIRDEVGNWILQKCPAND